jgi:shikimate kinase
MGAGKSSVGLALGRRLNWLFEDLDERIETGEGRRVAEIFRDSGEVEFRRAEHEALRHLLEELRGGVVRVVALGGGAFVQPENARLLELAGVPVVFLDAPVGELWRRCRQHASESGVERPLLKSFDEFQALYRARRKHYATAGLRITTANRDIEAIVTEIIQTLRLRKIAVRTQQGEPE